MGEKGLCGKGDRKDRRKKRRGKAYLSFENEPTLPPLIARVPRLASHYAFAFAVRNGRKGAMRKRSGRCGKKVEGPEGMKMISTVLRSLSLGYFVWCCVTHKRRALLCARR